MTNLPAREETWEGLAALAGELLDPLHERFGAVTLTYGFASPALVRLVPSRISPPLDQHAGAERNARGALICARGGQSCDLRVPGESALDVARWIQEKLPFDRLYLYGADRPLHVSYGPTPARYVCAMVATPRGRIPRDVTRRSWEEIAALLSPPGG